jgi:dihydropteroate synthase
VFPSEPVRLRAGWPFLIERPCVMGVLNTTPDSFSDGGRWYRDGQLDLDMALRAAVAMVADGAAIIDIGGESTRPGAAPVSEQQEMDRVLPLVERLAAEIDTVISVDTSSPQLMREAAACGAGLINDVRALRREGALQAAVATGLPVCLMHMQGEPGHMQREPHYQNVVAEVRDFLLERAARCEAAGIPRESILLDPGFGFGKTVRHNLQLLAGLSELRAAGYPLLAGLSRKSMIGKLLGRELGQRLPASLALALLAVERGALIVRAHDVRETVDALAMLAALREVEA